MGSEVMQWLFWQMANLGPMQGQAVTFTRYAAEKVPFAINRYTAETKRLYGVLERQLQNGNEYLVRNSISLADIACYGWLRNYRWAFGDEFESEFVQRYPNLNAWLQRMGKRKGVQAGMQVPLSTDIL